MGIVVMGTGGSYRFRGDLITQMEGCLYCDNCGSFSIRKCLRAKSALWFFIAGAITTLVFWIDKTQRNNLAGWLACTILVFFFLGLTGVFNLGYCCRKCGNRKITFDNPLHFVDYDRSVIDVPYERTLKLYQDDY